MPAAPFEYCGNGRPARFIALVAHRRQTMVFLERTANPYGPNTGPAYSSSVLLGSVASEVTVVSLLFPRQRVSVLALAGRARWP
jgi:hypothetical protein